MYIGNNGSKSAKNPKRKIAFFHELDNGGARRVVNEFAKNLKKDFDIDLFVTGKLEMEEEKFYNKVTAYKFKARDYGGHNWKVKLYKDTVELYRLNMLHKKISKKINDSYQLAFVSPSQFTQAPFLLRHLTIPSIYYAQEPLRIVYDKLFSNTNSKGFKRYYEKGTLYIRKIIDLQNIKQATKVLSNSFFSQKNIKSCYGIKSKVVYLAVDPSFFKPLEKTKDIDILYIGSKQSIDGYDLFESLKKEFSSKYKIVEHLREGKWVSDEKLRELYCRSKVVLCLSRNEPFGLMPLEAMSCGTPVVALKRGGYKESIVDGKTGFLIKDDIFQLKGAINKMLKKNTYLNMGEISRKHIVENWSWKRSSYLLKEIFINSFNK
jgi:glycosyltransferase involved in cell wall biosynthesis